MPERRDQQEGAEHEQHPLEALEQRDPGEDEDEAQHQRPEDAPEQHPELVGAGHREVAHDQRPHEHVVDAEALLDEVARDVLAGRLAAVPGEDHAGEGDADADPDRRLDGGFLGGGGVRLAVDQQQVDDQQHRHERQERHPDPGGHLEAREVLARADDDSGASRAVDDRDTSYLRLCLTGLPAEGLARHRGRTHRADGRDCPPAGRTDDGSR